jgi:hypothetical protein
MQHENYAGLHHALWESRLYLMMDKFGHTWCHHDRMNGW